MIVVAVGLFGSWVFGLINSLLEGNWSLFSETALLFAATAIVISFAVWRGIAQNRSEKNNVPVHGRVSARGVEFFEEVDEAYAWSRFTGYRRINEVGVLLFCQAKDEIMPIFEQTFSSEEDWRECLELVKANLPENQQ